VALGRFSWPFGILIRVCGKKFVGGDRVWGVGCGV
jgi:hypothetical protein